MLSLFGKETRQSSASFSFFLSIFPSVSREDAGRVIAGEDSFVVVVVVFLSILLLMILLEKMEPELLFCYLTTNISSHYLPSIDFRHVRLIAFFKEKLCTVEMISVLFLFLKWMISRS